MSQTDEISVVEQFERDDVFKQFVDDEFDVKSFTSNSLVGIAITEYLSKLSSGIALLDKELNSQVAANYNSLLMQANGLDSLEGVLQTIHGRIQALSLSAERLQLKITEPFNKVESQTRMLINLQKTCDLLRRMIRIMNLSARLHTYLKGDFKEIVKASQSLNELFYLMEGIDLSGINVLEKDVKFILDSRQKVEAQAKSMFENGIKTQNQPHIAMSIQVFHNLDILENTIEQTINVIVDKLHQFLEEAVDVKVLTLKQENLASKGMPGRATMPGVGNMAAFRASLWSNIEDLMNKIFSACNDIHLLYKVLSKKKDPISQASYLDILNSRNSENAMKAFWERIASLIKQVIKNTTKDSSYIKQTFENEYPKLLCYFIDLWKRVQQCNQTNVQDSQNSIDDGNLFKSMSFDPEKLLRDSLQNFEKSYLLRSESRMLDSVNVVFSMKEVPSKEDISLKILRAIASELNAANVDTLLANKVAKNVAKTVTSFTTKCEDLICEDEDSIQVIAPLTTSQTNNCKLIAILDLFFKDLNSLSTKICNDERAQSLIKNSLNILQECIKKIVIPMMVSISDMVEKIILTMHQENYSQPKDNNSDVSSQSSLYMKELQSFLSRVNSEYFQNFPKCTLVQQHIQELSTRIIQLFLRHVTLIRPLGDGGKLRIAADFAQLEMILSLLVPNIGELGKPYRTLRSFKPFLFQTPTHIAQSSLLGDVVPYSLVINFLFSKAPANFKSPHELAGWSLQFFSQWLDGHTSEIERLTLIRGTLENYVTFITQTGEKEFSPIYPVMLELLQKGMNL